MPESRRTYPNLLRERLAFDLMVYTGLRRGDVARLGWQHIRDGTLTIRTAKTGAVVTLPVLEPLRRSIEATRTGDLALISTAKGAPLTAPSFGNFFKDACRAAGVPGAAHGLRKAAATRLAEGGVSEAELNAVFGWAQGSRESATYISTANRARLAANALAKLVSPHHFDVAEGAGSSAEKTEENQAHADGKKGNGGPGWTRLSE